MVKHDGDRVKRDEVNEETLEASDGKIGETGIEKVLDKIRIANEGKLIDNEGEEGLLGLET